MYIISLDHNISSYTSPKNNRWSIHKFSFFDYYACNLINNFKVSNVCLCLEILLQNLNSRVNLEDLSVGIGSIQEIRSNSI